MDKQDLERLEKLKENTTNSEVKKSIQKKIDLISNKKIVRK